MPAIPATDPATFLWFLVFTVPIAIWVAWSDMSRMKIPNNAVMALFGVWVIAGFVLQPTNIWLWGFALLAIVLVIGFLLTSFAGVGAGDSKYAAAMAPFFTGADIRTVMALFAACILGAFACHRIARAIPAVRAATPGWASWTHHKFPLGLALSGLLVFYPAVALILP
ncbi:MAG: prepilin peptidase [Gemmobacter sp.]